MAKELDIKIQEIENISVTEDDMLGEEIKIISEGDRSSTKDDELDIKIISDIYPFNRSEKDDTDLDIVITESTVETIEIKIIETIEKTEDLLSTIETSDGLSRLEAAIKAIEMLIHLLQKQRGSEPALIKKLQGKLRELKKIAIEIKQKIVERTGEDPNEISLDNTDLDKIENKVTDKIKEQREIALVADLEYEICNDILESYPEKHYTEKSLLKHNRQENKVVPNTCAIASLKNALVAVGVDVKDLNEAQFLRKVGMDDTSKYLERNGEINLNKFYYSMDTNAKFRALLHENHIKMYIASTLISMVIAILNGGSVIYGRVNIDTAHGDTASRRLNSGLSMGHAVCYSGIYKVNGENHFVLNDSLNGSGNASLQKIGEKNFLANLLVHNQYRFILLPEDKLDNELAKDHLA